MREHYHPPDMDGAKRGCVQRKCTKFIIGALFGFTISVVLITNRGIDMRWWNGDLSSQMEPHFGSLKNVHASAEGGSVQPFRVNFPRILCWISTYPPNHRTKAIAVRDTWGRRCDKILFMSNEYGEHF